MKARGHLRRKGRFPIWWMLLAALLAGPTTGQNASSLNLEELCSRYNVSAGKINSAYSNDVSDASRDYAAGLDQLLARLKQAGLIESYLAVEEENERFKTNGSVLQAPESADPYIVKLRERFRQSIDEAEKWKGERMGKLSRSYVKALDGFIKAAMRRDEMEQALTAKQERDRV